MFKHGYAVIIGVDENQIDRLALPTVAKDVTAVHDVLIHPERCAYNPDNVKLLKGAESTQRNILDALFWLNEKVKADPEATAVIYYSGHGMEDKAANRYYLIPYDITDLARIRSQAIPAQTFNEEVADIQAKRTLVILDCCHAAGMAVKDIDLDTLDSRVKSAAFPIDLPQTKEIPVYTAEPVSKAVTDLLEGQGRAILNSSTGSQSSWVRSDGRMSIFTFHLIEALTGHAPHPDDATVVYVTDVMSWVTHQVKKSAAYENVEQTPLMRTSGVFPIAQLIGGKGLATAKGQPAPDPLAPLPQTGPATTSNQQGQSVSGKQTNIGAIQGSVGQIGDNINTGGGDYVGGDKVSGDKVMGDKVNGDKYEGINISGVQGSSISFGRGSQATVTTSPQHKSGENLSQLFTPLQQLIAQQAPALSAKVNALKEQVALGPRADDKVMAGLIQDLADGLSAVKPILVDLFQQPILAKTAGTTTEFVLERLR